MSTGRLPSTDGGIQPTVVDAKGDLLVGVAADSISRLAVGSNDQVLTADSSTSTGLKWAAASSGGMTLLSTTTLSGATTTISSISQSYNSLFLVFYGLTNATANGAFRILPNNGLDANAAVLGAEGTSASSAGWNNAQIRFSDTISILDRTNANNAGCLWIYNYTSTTNYKPFNGQFMFINNNGSKSVEAPIGASATNSAITSLVFANSGGNLLTGTVLLYGVK